MTIEEAKALQKKYGMIFSHIADTNKILHLDIKSNTPIAELDDIANTDKDALYMRNTILTRTIIVFLNTHCTVRMNGMRKMDGAGRMNPARTICLPSLLFLQREHGLVCMRTLNFSDDPCTLGRTIPMGTSLGFLLREMMDSRCV